MTDHEQKAKEYSKHVEDDLLREVYKEADKEDEAEMNTAPPADLTKLSAGELLSEFQDITCTHRYSIEGIEAELLRRLTPPPAGISEEIMTDNTDRILDVIYGILGEHSQASEQSLRDVITELTPPPATDTEIGELLDKLHDYFNVRGYGDEEQCTDVMRLRQAITSLQAERDKWKRSHNELARADLDEILKLQTHSDALSGVCDALGKARDVIGNLQHIYWNDQNPSRADDIEKACTSGWNSANDVFSDTLALLESTDPQEAQDG